jgi:hypothetical protein
MASMHEANGCATCYCTGEGGKESGCVEMRLVVSSLRGRAAWELVRQTLVFGRERINDDGAQTAGESKRLARPLTHPHARTPTPGENVGECSRVWWQARAVAASSKGEIFVQAAGAFITGAAKRHDHAVETLQAAQNSAGVAKRDSRWANSISPSRADCCAHPIARQQSSSRPWLLSPIHQPAKPVNPPIYHLPRTSAARAKDPADPTPPSCLCLSARLFASRPSTFAASPSPPPPSPITPDFPKPHASSVLTTTFCRPAATRVLCCTPGFLKLFPPSTSRLPPRQNSFYEPAL